MADVGRAYIPLGSCYEFWQLGIHRRRAAGAGDVCISSLLAVDEVGRMAGKEDGAEEEEQAGRG